MSSCAFHLQGYFILCVLCGWCIYQQPYAYLLPMFDICIFIFKGTLFGAHDVVIIMGVNKTYSEVRVSEHTAYVLYTVILYVVVYIAYVFQVQNGLKQDALFPLPVIFA
jgi:hypothetical protein